MTQIFLNSPPLPKRVFFFRVKIIVNADATKKKKTCARWE